ncbi:uncharacterized protein [Ambystoma mexicanum]|uniref:uncharacterized protein n=1 Tax=Ambystoma mexicanum TaxID=8296 RepID=UPI0037E6FB16
MHLLQQKWSEYSQAIHEAQNEKEALSDENRRLQSQVVAHGKVTDVSLALIAEHKAQAYAYYQEIGAEKEKFERLEKECARFNKDLRHPEQLESGRATLDHSVMPSVPRASSRLTTLYAQGAANFMSTSAQEPGTIGRPDSIRPSMIGPACQRPSEIDRCASLFRLKNIVAHVSDQEDSSEEKIRELDWQKHQLQRDHLVHFADKKESEFRPQKSILKTSTQSGRWGEFSTNPRRRGECEEYSPMRKRKSKESDPESPQYHRGEETRPSHSGRDSQSPGIRERLEDRDRTSNNISSESEGEWIQVQQKKKAAKQKRTLVKDPSRQIKAIKNVMTLYYKNAKYSVWEHLELYDQMMTSFGIENDQNSMEFAKWTFSPEYSSFFAGWRIMIIQGGLPTRWPS